MWSGGNPRPSVQMTGFKHYTITLLKGTLNPLGFTFLLMIDINFFLATKLNSISFFPFLSSFSGDSMILKLTLFIDNDFRKALLNTHLH